MPLRADNERYDNQFRGHLFMVIIGLHGKATQDKDKIYIKSFFVLFNVTND